MPRIRVDPSFVASLRRLSEGRRRWVLGNLQLFQRHPENAGLRFRPLRCAPGHFLIDSVRYDRIILRQEEQDLFTVVDCGGHEIIETWEARAARDP